MRPRLKSRLAEATFAAAVLSCWLGIWLARTVPDDGAELISMPAAELAGVTRVVWDVGPGYQWNAPYQGTLVLAGWPGDLRLGTSHRGGGAARLRLVREGETVFVRAVDPAGAGQEAADAARRRSPRLAAPVSLALPGTVTELSWPRMQLMMAGAADMRALTVSSAQVTVGALGDPYLRARDGADSQVVVDSGSSVLRGRLAQLTVLSLPEGDCSQVGGRRRKSGSVKYEGGFFTDVTVLSRGGTVQVSAMEEGMRFRLKATPETALQLGRLAYLEQLRIEDLDSDGAARLGDRDAARGDCPAARMKD